MLSFPFRHVYCIIFSYVCFNHVWTSFNIYTKCPLNGTLANAKTHMRDVTECINAIGYGLSAVIKAIIQQPKLFEYDYELYSSIVSINKNINKV